MIDKTLPVKNVVYNGERLPMYTPEAPDIRLQSKTVEPSTTARDVTADGGYDGLSSVHVNAIQTETKIAVANGTVNATAGKYMTSVTVALPVNTIYIGSSAPSSNLGQNDDWYIQTD